MNQTLGYAHTISYFVSTRKSVWYSMIYSNSTVMEQVVYAHRRSWRTERLAERAWWTKSQSSLRSISFRLSGFHSLLTSATVRISLFTLHQSEVQNLPDKWSHDAPLQRSGRHSFASLQKSHPNKRSSCYVRTEALCGMVVVPAQELFGILGFHPGVQKGSSFCDTGRLNFQAFAWRGI